MVEAVGWISYGLGGDEAEEGSGSALLVAVEFEVAVEVEVESVAHTAVVSISTCTESAKQLQQGLGFAIIHNYVVPPIQQCPHASRQLKKKLLVLT